MALTFFHVSVTCRADHLTRGQPIHDAHRAQLDGWRAGGHLVALGLAPDGATADHAEEVAPRMTEDLSVIGGLWVSYVVRPSPPSFRRSTSRARRRSSRAESPTGQVPGRPARCRKDRVRWLS